MSNGTDAIDAIRKRVEAYEAASTTHEWMTAKCRLERTLPEDLRFLLDYIERHQIGHVSREDQFLLNLEAGQ